MSDKLVLDDKTIPFNGGLISAVERVLLPSGAFSTLQNYRWNHPGFIQRKGQIEHCSEGDTSKETVTIFQLSKGGIDELRTFRQLVGGSVQEATNDAPSTTSGVFGSDVLAAKDNSIPASWGVINDFLLYSDGVRQHQVYGGDNQPVKAFIVYDGTPIIPVIPQIGNDYVIEVTDGVDTTVAVLDLLGTITEGKAFYIMSSVPTADINFVISAINGTAAVLGVEYWNGIWTDVSGLNDGTDNSGDTLGQSGAVTWTLPSDELPTYQFGRSGFWYRFYITGEDSDTKLLLHGDGDDASTIITDTMNNHIVTANADAQIDTAQSKFGGASILFDGTGDNLSIPNSTDLYPTVDGDFTLDCWIRLNANGKQQAIYSATDNGTTQPTFHLSINSSNYLISTVGNNGCSGGWTSTANNNALSVNTWYHVECGINRTTDLIQLFVGGTEVTYSTQDSLAADLGLCAGAVVDIRVGSEEPVANSFDGWIEELRVSQTLRHDSNFTPETTPYASLTLDSEVEISAVSYDTTWQDIRNVWDGVFQDAIEAQVYSTATAGYRIYGTGAIVINKLGTGDYVYFATIYPISGFYLDPGATPNKLGVTITTDGDMDFIDGGDGTDTIIWRGNGLLDAGFEAGMSITITSTDTNNYEFIPISVTSSTMVVPTGTVTAEADQTGTLTFGPRIVSIDSVETWEGTDWGGVTSLDDSSNGISKQGFVTWNRTSITPEKTHFNDTQYHAYWYRFKVDAEITGNVNIGILTMPYHSMDEFGISMSNGVWKDRAILSFDRFGKFIYLSATDNMMMLNGLDFGVLEAGDGRSNKVRAIIKFYNELIVLQAEKGAAGGCTTLFEGFSPETFGKLLLSSQIGIMNAKCIETIDGVLTSTETDVAIKTITFWLSRYGMIACDGTVLSIISDDVRNYFDPLDDNSIRRGYEDKMWLKYDSAYNVIRVGLVTGDSATTCNTFLVFDRITGKFGTDTLGQNLSCMAEVEAASGDVMVLQLGGGATDGKVHQLNQTDDDGDTPIDADLVMELDGKGVMMKLQQIILRVKSLASGELTITTAINGNVPDDHEQIAPMTAKTVGDTYRRIVRMMNKIQSDHFSIRIRNNEANTAPHLEDVAIKTGKTENNT